MKGHRKLNGLAIHYESLEEGAEHILEEVRTVVPGIQAIFGFQLIAVFNQRFDTALSLAQQELHFLAIGFTALSMALVMTPTAYHRLAEAGCITKFFISLSTKMLTLAMGALAAGTCTDFLLIGMIITRQPVVAAVTAVFLFCIFISLWFIFPKIKARAKLTVLKRERYATDRR